MMSAFSDALHEAIVTAAVPFVGKYGADAIGSGLEFLGDLVTGHGDGDAGEPQRAA